MTDIRVLKKLLCASCIGSWTLFAAPSHAWDNLGEYDYGLVARDRARPTEAFLFHGVTRPATVAEVDETVLDRKAVHESVRDHRHRVIDQPGDYLDDFSGHGFMDDLSAVTSASFQDQFAAYGEGIPVTPSRKPDGNIVVVIKIKGLTVWNGNLNAISPHQVMMTGAASPSRRLTSPWTENE